MSTSAFPPSDSDGVALSECLERTQFFPSKADYQQPLQQPLLPASTSMDTWHVDFDAWSPPANSPLATAPSIVSGSMVSTAVKPEPLAAKAPRGPTGRRPVTPRATAASAALAPFSPQLLGDGAVAAAAYTSAAAGEVGVARGTPVRAPAASPSMRAGTPSIAAPPPLKLNCATDEVVCGLCCAGYKNGDKWRKVRHIHIQGLPREPLQRLDLCLQLTRFQNLRRRGRGAW